MQIIARAIMKQPAVRVLMDIFLLKQIELKLAMRKRNTGQN